MIWQVADAGNKLSEVLDRASEEGPQIVTYREKRFVIAEEPADENAPSDTVEPGKDFLDFLLNGPRFDGVVIERDPSPMREIKL